MRIDPGGHVIRVSADDNVLGAALAAGIRLPHSCRAGRCASCKSKLVRGEVEYPAGPPPGITADEIARGEVLLCQARPRSDLVVAARRIALDAPESIAGEIVAIEPLSLGALRVRLRLAPEVLLSARPGQYIDAANGAGASERLAVIATRPGEIDLEAGDDGSLLRLWLEEDAAPGSALRLTGPFNALR
ncbi:MAG TPA: 2Fe-2S iron-sulfur cluster-binding protein [Steroidobacteraceae bacterium]|nr:2Fe-2S iron-sulfur cluster-binding protein [Steroidobacteraceae bacterium]